MKGRERRLSETAARNQRAGKQTSSTGGRGSSSSCWQVERLKRKSIETQRTSKDPEHGEL